MTKSKNEFEEFLDDKFSHEFDSFANQDFDSPGNNQEISEDRNPIHKFSSGALKEFKDSEYSVKNIKRLVRRAAPSGYVAAYDLADDYTDRLSGIYDKVQKELEPSKKILKDVARKNISKIDKLLPKTLAEKVKRSLEEEPDRERKEVDYDSELILTSLSDIFGKLEVSNNQSTEQSITNTELDLKLRAKETEINTNSNNSIIKGINTLVSFQNTILFKYYRKSLELQYRQVFYARDTFNYLKASQAEQIAQLTAIVKNTGLPEETKVKLTEALGKSNKLKLAGAVQTKVIDKLRNYPKQVFSNIERKSVDWARDLNGSIQTARETQQQMREMGFTSEEEVLGQMITDAISEGSANKLGDYIKNVIYEKFPNLKIQSRKIENSVMQHTRLLNTELSENQDTISTKGKLLGFFKDIFGTVSGGDDEKVNHNLREQALESAGFDLISRRTLIEIIPGFQSRQLQELETMTSGIQALVKAKTGKELEKKDRVVYSTSREEFISQTDAVKDTKAEVKSKISTNLASDVKYMLEVIDPEKKLDIDSRIELGMILTSESNNGKYFSIPRLLKSEINNGPNSDKIMTFVKGRYGLDDEGKPLEGDDLLNDDGTDKEIAGERTTDENRLINIFNRLVDNIGDIQSVVNSFNATGEKELLRLANIVTKKKTDGKDSKEDLFNYAEKRSLIEQVLREGYVKLKTAEDEQALRDNPPNPPDSNPPPQPPSEDNPPDVPPGDNGGNPPDINPSPDDSSGGNDDLTNDNPDINPPSPPPEVTPPDRSDKSKQEDLFPGRIDDSGDDTNEDERNSSDSTKSSNEKQRDIFDEEIDISDRIDEITTEITESFEQSLKDMVERFTEEYEKTQKKTSSENLNDITFQELMDQLRSNSNDITTNRNRNKRTGSNNSNDDNDSDVEVLIRDDVLTGYVFDIKELIKTNSEITNKNTTEILSILKEGKLTVNSTTSSIINSITKDDIKELVESINKTLKDNLSELNNNLSQRMTDILSHIGTGGIFSSIGKLASKTKTVLKDTGKSIFKVGNLGFDKLVSTGKSALGLASNVAGWSFNKTLGKVKDIYVNDRPNEPIMTVSRLRAGEYIDSSTGKVIKQLKDVTGEVKDKEGNLVLSLDDFRKGLHVREGDIKTMFGSAWGALKDGAKALFDVNMFIPRSALKIGKGILNTAKDLYYAPKDVYLEGESNPRLTSQGFKDGLYVSKLTGKKLKNHLDIDGAVTNTDGSQTIISQEEYQSKKLLLANGKEIDRRGIFKKVLDKGLQFGKWLKKKGKESFDFVTGLGKSVFDKLTGFVSNTFNKLTGRFDFDNLPKDIIFSTNKTNAILIDIYNFLINRFDSQGKLNNNNSSSLILGNTDNKVKSNTLVDVNGNPLETSNQVKVERVTKKLKDKVVNTRDKLKSYLPKNIKERLKSKVTDKLISLKDSIDEVKDDNNKSLIDYLAPYKAKYTDKINKLKEIKLPTNLINAGNLIGNYGLKAKEKIDSAKNTFKEIKENGLVNSFKAKKEKMTAEGKLSMIASLAQVLSLSKAQELIGKQFSNISNLGNDLEGGKSLRNIVNRIRRIATIKDRDDTKLSIKDRILAMKDKIKDKLFNRKKPNDNQGDTSDDKKGLLSKLFGGAKGALTAGATGLMGLLGKKDKPEGEEDSNGSESDGMIKGSILTTALTTGLAFGKSMLSKAGGLLGKAGTSVLGKLGLNTAGRLAGGGLLRGAVGMGLRGLGLAAGIALNPWVLGAYVAYEGYGMIKDAQYSAKLEDLEKLRYLQYGIPVNNEKAVFDIRKFEDTMLSHFKIDDKFVVTLDISEDEIWDKVTGYFSDMFGLGSGSVISKHNFTTWFYKRFVPVVAQHMQSCKRFGDLDLDDVDDDIDNDDIPSYVKSVQFGRDQAINGVVPYAIMASPWIDIKLVDNTKLIKDLSDQLIFGKNNKPKTVNNTSNIKNPSDKVKEVAATVLFGKMALADEKIPDKLPNTKNSFYDVKKHQEQVEKSRKKRLQYSQSKEYTAWLSTNGNNKYKPEPKLILPVVGTFESSMYDRVDPLNPNNRKHHGLDIVAEKGTPVKAAANGTIRKASYDHYYGNTIYIEHDDGRATRYSHLLSFHPELKINAQVKQGDVIGYVGKSGKARGNHLHFEYLAKYISDNESEVLNPVMYLDESSKNIAIAELNKLKEKLNENKIKDYESSSEGVIEFPNTKLTNPVYDYAPGDLRTDEQIVNASARRSNGYTSNNNISNNSNSFNNNPTKTSLTKPRTFGSMMQEYDRPSGNSTTGGNNSNRTGYVENISSLVTNPNGTSSNSNMNTNNTSKPTMTKLSSDKKSMMTNVYKSFKEAGFSDNQAKALTAEVGRENGYNSKTVFGTHGDAANGATNIGFFSWQGSRATALKKQLAAKGLIDNSGKMIQSQESLNEMAKFAKGEMSSGQYKGLGDFMANKNVDSQTAAKQLGKGYIKWAYGQDRLSSGKSFNWRDHDNRRAGYYAQIEELTSNGKVNSQPSMDSGSSNTSPNSKLSSNGNTNIKAPDNQLTGNESLKEKVKTSGSGKFVTPAPGRISSPFGMRTHPVLKIKKMHTGIDIAAPMGTPVVATTSGTVRKAGMTGGYGNIVYLDHDDGATCSRYAHLSRFAEGITDGVKVRTGQTIAYVGSTGRSTGPHLHFEIRKGQGTGNDTTPIDPTSMLGGKASSIAKEVGKENDNKVKGSKSSKLGDDANPEVEPVDPSKASGSNTASSQQTNTKGGNTYTEQSSNSTTTTNTQSNTGLTPNSLIAGEPRLSNTGGLQPNANTPFQNISNIIGANSLSNKNAISMTPNPKVNRDTLPNITQPNVTQPSVDLNPIVEAHSQIGKQTNDALNGQNKIMLETNNLLSKVIDSIKSLGSVGNSNSNNSNTQSNQSQPGQDKLAQPDTKSNPNNIQPPAKEINPIISFRKQ